MQVQFIKKSSNVKVGRIPVTNSDRSTCPDSCPMKADGSCYAEAGFHTRLNWNALDRGERSATWGDLCSSVAKLPDGQLWRHNVSGDLPHNDGVIDAEKLSQLVAVQHGKRGFTYTHHDLSIRDNRKAIRHANESGFTVNLSADDLADADAKAALDIGPVAVVLPSDQFSNTTTPDGRKVVICPAVVKDGVSCETCKLCAIPNRSAIIGFPAHGSRKNIINARIN